MNAADMMRQGGTVAHEASKSAFDTGWSSCVSDKIQNNTKRRPTRTNSAEVERGREGQGGTSVVRDMTRVRRSKQRQADSNATCQARKCAESVDTGALEMNRCRPSPPSGAVRSTRFNLGNESTKNRTNAPIQENKRVDAGNAGYPSPARGVQLSRRIGSRLLSSHAHRAVKARYRGSPLRLNVGYCSENLVRRKGG